MPEVNVEATWIAFCSDVPFGHFVSKEHLSIVASEGIPSNVAEFLAEHIDSVVQLEALLLLQSRPEARCSAADIARELRIDPTWTAAAMSKLAGAGILEMAEGSFRYAPRSELMHQTILSLAHEYSERRVSIIGLIFSRPPESIRKFTDAFRFRKEE